MNESILETMRAMLGPSVVNAYTAFDQEILVHVNTILMILSQAGVGAKGFRVTGTQETWGDFLDGSYDLEAVKTYVYLRVRILFDPPTSSFVLDAVQKQADEMLWRLNVLVDPDA